LFHLTIGSGKQRLHLPSGVRPRSENLPSNVP